jgi:hypothetical protein
MTHHCIYCGKDFEGFGKMEGLDKPFYVNLFFHETCYSNVERPEDMLQFVKDHIDDIEIMARGDYNGKKQKSKLLDKK